MIDYFDRYMAFKSIDKLHCNNGMNLNDTAIPFPSNFNPFSIELFGNN